MMSRNHEKQEAVIFTVEKKLKNCLKVKYRELRTILHKLISQSMVTIEITSSANSDTSYQVVDSLISGMADKAV